MRGAVLLLRVEQSRAFGRLHGHPLLRRVPGLYRQLSESGLMDEPYAQIHGLFPDPRMGS